MESRAPSHRTFVRQLSALSLAFTGLLLASVPASADYIYTYIPVYPGVSHTGRLTVTDAAVAAGSLTYIQPFICGFGGCSSTGDPTGLVNLTYSGTGLPTSITPPTNIGTAIKVNITFNPDGTLSGMVTGLDGFFDNDLTTSGSEFNWFGFWNGPTDLSCPDELYRQNLGCLDPGYWYSAAADTVPEPPSFWIFLSGLAAMAAMLALFPRLARQPPA